MLNEKLIVGVIQTSLDYRLAWKQNVGASWSDAVKISHLEEKRARKEIRHFFASLRGFDRKPDIVLLPELAVPLGYESRLRRISETLESIIIAGMDYRIHAPGPTVSNEAVLIVPRRLKGKRIASQTAVRRIGKTYPAPGEKSQLLDIHPPVHFMPNSTVWLFESAELGSFGVTVCYDFMDLDRIVLYRSKIQTLFILSYNKDITSFDHIAESVARTVFCNVVICNCGFFGGSMAVSPYTKPFKRTIYRHTGNKLPNAQLIELPLKSLAEHQVAPKSNSDFKSLPPGFDPMPPLKIYNRKI